MKIAGTLLDTCAVIWLSNNQPLSAEAQSAIVEAGEHGRIFVSPITAWEVGLLVSRGRLSVPLSPLRWFQRVLDSGVLLAPMTPEALIESSSLPGDFHRDPADRILAATARLHDYQVVTRDGAFLKYGEQGHVAVLAC